MAFLTCPCGFRLRRLAQSVVPALGTSYVCSYVLSYMCSHMRARVCVLSYACSNMHALICVLASVCSYVVSYGSHMCALICVLICALICALSCMCSYMCAPICSHAPVFFSQFHPPRSTSVQTLAIYQQFALSETKWFTKNPLVSCSIFCPRFVWLEVYSIIRTDHSS